VSWTYSGNPSASNADAVRFLMGDVVATAEVTLSNAEVTYLLATWGNDVYEAARNGCEMLAARYTGKATTSKSVGDLSLSKDYSGAASRLREQAAAILQMRMRKTPPRPWVDPKNLETARGRGELGMQGHEFYTGVHDNRAS
jgi:hypothetical protein